MVRHYLTTPNLAYSMVPISSPSFWKPVFEYADLNYLEELTYEVNGVPYGVFGHDWRSRPPAAWLDVLASRETSRSFEPAKEAPSRPVLVLSEEAFGDAVRQVLKNYTRPDRLLKNPLLSSRIVEDNISPESDDQARLEMLMGLVNEAVDLIKNNAKQEKAFKALDRTYLRPATSQEQAAELLDLPFSTFRRHLTKGVTELTAVLWRKELGM